jgi:RNA polymerase sigma-70 factor (ECF subfamily)
LNKIEQETLPDQRWDLLMQQVNQLNHMDRSLIFLYLERKSYAEMAEITGLSETNVGTRMTRIKQKLKKAFESKTWN